MKEIGTRLRAERKRLGLSQNQLGAMGGVAANAQGKYESGERLPKADYLVAVAESGVDVLYVLTNRYDHDAGHPSTPLSPQDSLLRNIEVAVQALRAAIEPCAEAPAAQSGEHRDGLDLGPETLAGVDVQVIE